MATTWRTIVEDALTELGVLQAGEAASGDDATFVLAKANRLIDNWNAERAAVYNESFARYTLTPNLSPHTIGPTGTFVVDSRPVSVENANIVLNNVDPIVKVPLMIRDDDWYAGQPVPTIATTLPTDLYYSPSWPNGSLYLWPVPTFAYQLELWTRVLLSAVDLADTFTLPPGYQDALTLTLAEDCSAAFQRTPSPSLVALAQKARARIFANNDITPRLATQDSGMPFSRASGGTRSSFNYMTGMNTTSRR